MSHSLLIERIIDAVSGMRKADGKEINDNIQVVFKKIMSAGDSEVTSLYKRS